MNHLMIYRRLQAMQQEDAAGNCEYCMFSMEREGAELYYGLDRNANYVFAIESLKPRQSPSLQKTKSLILGYNLPCRLTLNRVEVRKVMHLMTCLSRSEEEHLAFIRLTESFAGSFGEQRQDVASLFSCLVSLFASENSVRSEKELRGFYAELFTIKFFHEQGVDLSEFWQKRDRLKFDFSISARKRIEVKSTLGENRTHHFKHEQLIADICEIYVISYLLREDDQGLSLWDLINDIRHIAHNSFATLLYIERFLKGIPQETLEHVKFDQEYTRQHLKIYNVLDIPKFDSPQPDGVSQTEYDSTLSTINDTDILQVVEWIRER